MVGRRPVGSLRECSLRIIPRMVRENIVRTAHGTQAAWYRVFTGQITHGTLSGPLMAHRQPGTGSLQVIYLMEHCQDCSWHTCSWVQGLYRLDTSWNIVRTAHGTQAAWYRVFTGQITHGTLSGLLMGHRQPGTGSLQVRYSSWNIVRTAHGTQAAWYRVFTGQIPHGTLSGLLMEHRQLGTWSLQVR
jgi:hypothetical protein